MAFVLFFAYRREMSDRRTFTLRMELKGAPAVLSIDSKPFSFAP